MPTDTDKKQLKKTKMKHTNTKKVDQARRTPRFSNEEYAAVCQDYAKLTRPSLEKVDKRVAMSRGSSLHSMYRV